MLNEADNKTSRDKLIYMANQIAGFFATMKDAEAADGVADHINKFWEPRMRRQLLQIIEEGGTGLKPQVLQAAPKVRRPKQASEEPGR
ncbi:formate dehydrogenase subunit delta [Chelativorans sp. Marseille-P2723]|uniref:formate dehydrogenase subunit delta n=1 Tax=Chelativorans sp. Marseille-P2723 TaxID=2709133 RepID=UPI00156EA20F|nr:formate dehydrogenase subunit delta [Chelativorans sp. Marseille-P2723]